MVRALLREHQMGDRDNLSEDEHDVLVHENLVTSGTLDFQDGTISGTGAIYCNQVYTPSNSFTYFGNPTTSGSWRMGISGEDFIHQKYNGSTWETEQRLII